MSEERLYADGDLITGTPGSDWVSTLEVLKQGGVHREHWNAVRKDQRARKRVSEAFKGDGPSNPLFCRQEHALLDWRIFGPDEYAYHGDLYLSAEQLAQVPRFPYSEDLLRSPCPLCNAKEVRRGRERMRAECCFAFLGVDTLSNEDGTVDRLDLSLSDAADWAVPPRWDGNLWTYDQPKVALELAPMSFRWHMIHIAPFLVSGLDPYISVGEIAQQIGTYAEQLAELERHGYTVPSATTVIFAWTLAMRNYPENKVIINPEHHAYRCAERYSDELRYAISLGNAGSMYMRLVTDDQSMDRVVAAAELKPDLAS